MFFCYLLLDALFENDAEMIQGYWALLEDVVNVTDDGMKLLPELFTVPADKVR